MPPALDREAPGQGPLIQGFSGTAFNVDGRLFPHGLLLSPLWARDWAAPALDVLAPADVEEALAIAPMPEFLLLGTGASLRRPSPAFTSAVEARGIGVELMDSRTAARAWGVLRAEGRWIAAALLPLG